MSDNCRSKHAAQNSQEHARCVDALATQALSVMAARRQAGHAAHRSAHLRDLFNAAIEPSGDSLGLVVRDILRIGVPSETIADLYVPEVARRLGAAWTSDRLSFVEVSIGAARLQSLARDLTALPDPCDSSVPRVAVITPHREDHTLGAVVITGQLRRLGVAVRMLIGETDSTVAGSLRDDPPCAAFISSSHSERLDDVAGLVACLRETVGRSLQVIVGGPVLSCEDVDVLKDTAADHVSADVYDAVGWLRPNGWDQRDWDQRDKSAANGRERATAAVRL